MKYLCFVSSDNFVLDSSIITSILLKMHKIKNYQYYHSIKAVKCQWVSLFVCMFVLQLLRNGESQQAETLRDDFPWDWEGFRLKNIWIRRTVVSWKIACILAPHSTLAVNFILSSMNLQSIWEVGRGWGDQWVIGCLKETTTCVVVKPLVVH